MKKAEGTTGKDNCRPKIMQTKENRADVCRSSGSNRYLDPNDSRHLVLTQLLNNI